MLTVTELAPHVNQAPRRDFQPDDIGTDPRRIQILSGSKIDPDRDSIQREAPEYLGTDAEIISRASRVHLKALPLPDKPIGRSSDDNRPYPDIGPRGSARQGSVLMRTPEQVREQLHQDELSRQLRGLDRKDWDAIERKILDDFAGRRLLEKIEGQVERAIAFERKALGLPPEPKPGLVEPERKPIDPDKRPDEVDDSVSPLLPTGPSSLLGNKGDIEKHPCERPRRIGFRHIELSLERVKLVRCRSCEPCRTHRRERLTGELVYAIQRWSGETRVRVVDAGGWPAVKKQLQRQRRQRVASGGTGAILAADGELRHVSIPLADGRRMLFTEADIEGDVVDVADTAALRALMADAIKSMSTAPHARVDGSSGWRMAESPNVPRKKEWERISETKKTFSEIVKVLEAEGIEIDGRGCYSVAHLSNVGRCHLHWLLGYVTAQSTREWSPPVRRAA